MANTTNLNLVKPAGTDYALVSVINGNWDIIDSKVGAIPANESAQSQITALNNQMATLNSKVASLIVAEDVSTDFATVNAGATQDFTKSVTKTGYTPIGIIMITGGNIGSCVIKYFFISNGSMSVGIENKSSANKNINIVATILYIKS